MITARLARGKDMGMEPYYYRENIRKTLEEDSAEIAAGFIDIIKGNLRVQLKLVNYFKGLPISYPATPVEMAGCVLELDVHPQQAVALEQTGSTFIKCSYFDRPMLADVKDADVRRMMASLSNFRFVEILAEQRVSLRLKLEPPCDAQIVGDGGPVDGKVLDISLGGVSIRTSCPSNLRESDEVKLKLMVPNLLQSGGTSLEVRSTVVAVGSEEEGEVCRFAIELDPHVEGVISRFIFQRQVDLIRELKEQS